MDGETASNNLGHLAKPDAVGWLVMPTACGRSRAFPIHKSPTTLGRSPRCDIRIAIPSVGRRHCEIVQSGAILTIQTVADHVVLLNSKQTSRAALQDGDTIVIDRVGFAFCRQLQEPPEPPVIDVAQKVPGTPSAVFKT